ncbi:MAG: hypothetical protein ABSF47_02755 [Minisyncoccia bacterium]|jgi:hypothetical protein
MKKSKLITHSIRSALGVALYTAIVAFILFNGQMLFGKFENFWGPFVVLLLFVVSAAVIGALILGMPILMYFEGDKLGGVKLFAYSVG